MLEFQWGVSGMTVCQPHHKQHRILDKSRLADGKIGAPRGVQERL